MIPVDTASFNLLSNNQERIVKKFIREAFGTDPEVLKSASPFYNLAADESYPDFLIFTTSKREPAVQQSRKFTEKLCSAGCKVQFIIVDGYTHSEMNQGMYDETGPIGPVILNFIRK